MASNISESRRDDVVRNITFKKTGTKGEIYIEEADDSYIHVGIRCKDVDYTRKNLKFEWSGPVSKGTKTYNLTRNGKLKRIWAFPVPKSGTVKFTLKKTGTTELGGPTTITKKITRSESKPNPPDIVQLYMTSDTSAYVYWSVRWAGGTGITTSYQVAYAKTKTGTKTIIKGIAPKVNRHVEGEYTIRNLEEGRVYYVFVRAVNKKGVGKWSPARGIITRGGAMMYYDGRWRHARVYVKTPQGWKRTVVYVRKSSGWVQTR